MKIGKASSEDPIEEMDENVDRFVNVMRQLEQRTSELERLVQLVPFKRETAMPQRAVR